MPRRLDPTREWTTSCLTRAFKVTVGVVAAHTSILILLGHPLQSQITFSRPMLPSMVCLAHQNIWLLVTERVFAQVSL